VHRSGSYWRNEIRRLPSSEHFPRTARATYRSSPFHRGAPVDAAAVNARATVMRNESVCIVVFVYRGACGGESRCIGFFKKGTQGRNSESLKWRKKKRKEKKEAGRSQIACGGRREGEGRGLPPRHVKCGHRCEDGLGNFLAPSKPWRSLIGNRAYSKRRGRECVLMLI
jgi:hypothetical protein